MKLFQRTNAVYRGNICPGDFVLYYKPGKIYSEDAIPDYINALDAEQVANLFAYIDDGPPDAPDWTSAAKPELAKYARSLRDWINDPVGQQLGWHRVLRPMFASGPCEVTMPDLVVPLLNQLVDAAIRLGRSERADTKGLDESGALVVLNGLVEWIELPEGPPTGGKALEESPPPLPRLIVDIEKEQATFDGKPYEVSSKNALRWIKVLGEHAGEWISGIDLKRYDSELDGARTHKLKPYLPDPILALIDSETGKGSRIRL